jgi:hypothetical protein
MDCKKKLEEFLDRHFGTMSPNLPTRVMYCFNCRGFTSLKQLEKGVCHGHRMTLADNSLWNCLRTIIPI